MTDFMTQKPMEPLPVVDRVESLSDQDIRDLCDATEAAILGGGGFGWVDVPPRENLDRYWRGVIAMPARVLLIARLDNVVCGTCQLWKPPSNNEAQAHVVQLTTHFVAPWARGHGLARKLVEKAEIEAKAEGFAVINLEVRETMTRAIEIYEGLGFLRFGTHPYSVRLTGENLAGHYYYKVIDPQGLSVSS